MGVPEGDLDGLMGSLAFDQLDSVIVDSSVLEEFGSQVQREHVRKVTYSSGTFVGASSAIKPAICGLREG